MAQTNSVDAGPEPFFSPPETAHKTSTNNKITNPIHQDLTGLIFSAILSDSTSIRTKNDETTHEKMVTRELITDARTFSNLSLHTSAYDSLSITVSDEMLAISDDDSRNQTDSVKDNNRSDTQPTPKPKPNIKMYGHIIPEESFIILTAGCVAPVILATLILLVLGYKRQREESWRRNQMQNQVNDFHFNCLVARLDSSFNTVLASRIVYASVIRLHDLQLRYSKENTMTPDNNHNNVGKVKPFKERKPFISRKEEVEGIRAKFPTKIPVIVEKYSRESYLPTLDKMKFLVPEEVTMSQFVSIIRNRMLLHQNQAFYLVINNKSMVCMSRTLSEIYHDNRDDDGFLYVTYASQEVFGSDMIMTSGSKSR
uniref:Autophagy-related protein n=1 Tax=Strigamia maritima TaxID=126957 RepID=T1JL13_STRMM